MCSHVVNSKNFFVNDATEDVRFKGNPLVTGGPKTRFYARALLYSPKKEILGSFSIVDFKPRAFSAREEEQLLALAIETFFQHCHTLTLRRTVPGRDSD
jgi:GAF domain-containing protein